ncbi:MAG TPA: hypothetical protein VKB19_07235 [Pedobacter sp.]|nr:hypothetical protein [Pedobacter sp.]
METQNEILAQQEILLNDNTQFLSIPDPHEDQNDEDLPDDDPGLNHDDKDDLSLNIENDDDIDE